MVGGCQAETAGGGGVYRHATRDHLGALGLKSLIFGYMDPSIPRPETL